MQWKYITLATVSGALLAVIVNYFLWVRTLTEFKTQFQPTVNQLNQELQHLKQHTLPQLATLDDVKAVHEELKATLTAALQVSIEQEAQLTTQIEQTQKAVIDYANDMNKNLKNTLMAALQANTEKNTQLRVRIENIHQAIDDLLATMNQRQQNVQTLMPAGTVMAYAGGLNDTIQQQLHQAGWLICDGRELKREQYPELFQAIKTNYGNETTDTFKIPDFRGVFLRGLDLGRQLDPERTLGHYQQDTNQHHSHTGNTQIAGNHQHEAQMAAAGQHRHLLEAEGFWFTSKQRNERRAMTDVVDDNQEYRTTANGEHQHTLMIKPSGEHQHPLMIQAQGEHESRPKNYPVIYIIKFKH